MSVAILTKHIAAQIYCTCTLCYSLVIFLLLFYSLRATQVIQVNKDPRAFQEAQVQQELKVTLDVQVDLENRYSYIQKIIILVLSFISSSSFHYNEIGISWFERCTRTRWSSR